MRSTNGRTEILRAARTTFASHSYDGASIRDIAKEADLSLSALYYYFSSKQEALFDLIHSAYRQYIDMARQALTELDDPVERTAVVVRFLIRFRIANPQISRVVLRDAERLGIDEFSAVHALQKEAREVLVEPVRAGIEAGAFTVSDPVLTSRAILSLCNSIPLWFRTEGSVSAEKLEREYTEAALRILGHGHDATELDRLLALEVPDARTTPPE